MKTTLVKKPLVAIATAALSMMSTTSDAADYPVRPIRFVIPFPAGGPTDAVGRILSQTLTPTLGQQVIIDNRAGADGSIGAEIIMRAQPDGYTLLMGTSSTMAAVPALRKQAPYEPTTDFAPVTMLGYLSMVMVVNSSLSVKTVGELIAYARANPGKLHIAAANPPTIFALGQLRSFGKFVALDVQYKGDVAAMPDLLTGRMNVMVGGTNLLLPHVKDGKLRALATLSETRTPPAPDVPTMAEAGFPKFSIFPWVALFAPAKTPTAVIERITREAGAALDNREARAQFTKIGFDPQASTPAKLHEFVKEQKVAWASVAREIGLPQQ
ncbi:MAG TPA: tripartite tricarboxylate transporter substrate binding protein [Burkholderiales bacterium]|nr:tripartite tricarboxylate transporter substrate binding protein [Burkholderiales bacterium]